MKFKTAVVSLLFIFAALATTARAAVTTVTVTGTITSGNVGGSVDFQGLAPGTHLMGDSATIVMTFDDSQGVWGSTSLCGTSPKAVCEASIANGTVNGTALHPVTAFSVSVNGYSTPYNFGGGAATGNTLAKLKTGTGAFGQYYAHIDSNNFVNAYVTPTSTTDPCWPSSADWRLNFPTSPSPCNGTDSNLSSTLGSFGAYAGGVSVLADFTPTSITVVGCACDVPEFEISAFDNLVGWAACPGYTTPATCAEYYATLTDLNDTLTNPFDGTQVIEEALYSAGPNTCTGGYSYIIPNGKWNVTYSVYEHDAIGVYPSDLYTYSTEFPSPFTPTCSMTVYQQMKYYCSTDGIWYPYGSINTGNSNAQVTVMSATQINGSRGTASATTPATNPY